MLEKPYRVDFPILDILAESTVLVVERPHAETYPVVLAFHVPAHLAEEALRFARSRRLDHPVAGHLSLVD